MKETSVFDVALVLIFGAAFATSAVVTDWWKHLISPGASATQPQQELVAPPEAS